MANVKEVKSEKFKVKSSAKVKTVKTVKAEPVVKVEDKKVAGKSTKLNLSVPMYAFTGTVTEKLALPEDIFGLKVNKKLLAQAIRVYTTNEQTHNSNTKTRGEVEGSTRKIYKQKGTGNARHGAIRAPIFVGGGIALGPKSRKTVLDLPKKMKKAALLAALSQKASEGEIFGITDLEKATGKTSQMSKLFGQIAKKSILIIDGGLNEKALRASRNLKRVNFTTADRLNALEVIRHKSLVLTKSAVEKFKTKSESFGDAQDKSAKSGAVK